MFKGKPYSTALFISGGGSFATYAKKSPLLAGIEIRIIADRREVKLPEMVDHFLIKAPGDEYWEHFLELARTVDLVFLNFNWKVPAHICRELQGKMINQHPSLLPSFKGLGVFGEMVKSGVRVAGSTFHFVTPELDGGPIIAQTLYSVSPADTPEILSRKNWLASRDAYIQVIKWFAEGRIQWDGGQKVTVINARYDLGASIPNLEIPACA